MSRLTCITRCLRLFSNLHVVRGTTSYKIFRMFHMMRNGQCDFVFQNMKFHLRIAKVLSKNKYHIVLLCPVFSEGGAALRCSLSFHCPCPISSRRNEYVTSSSSYSYYSLRACEQAWPNLRPSCRPHLQSAGKKDLQQQIPIIKTEIVYS